MQLFKAGFHEFRVPNKYTRPFAQTQGRQVVYSLITTCIVSPKLFVFFLSEILNEMASEGSFILMSCLDLTSYSRSFFIK